MAIAQNNPITYNDITTALNAKADDPHNHDDRYYTESEVESILNEVTPPPAAPVLSVNGPRLRFTIKNTDTRNVTFYYKDNDSQVSNTNYDGFVTVAPNTSSSEILLTPNIYTYVKGYIRGIPGPVDSIKGVHSGGNN